MLPVVVQRHWQQRYPAQGSPPTGLLRRSPDFHQTAGPPFNQLAPGAISTRVSPLEPIPSDIEVQNGMTVLPAKSLFFHKIPDDTRGLTPPEGYPSKTVS